MNGALAQEWCDDELRSVAHQTYIFSTYTQVGNEVVALLNAVINSLTQCLNLNHCSRPFPAVALLVACRRCKLARGWYGGQVVI